MRLRSPFKKENKVKSFLEIFPSERIRASSCNRIQNSVLPCNINTTESLFHFRHIGSCCFWNNGSRMLVREHGLLHGIAVSRFLSMPEAIYDLNVMSFEFLSVSPQTTYIFLDELRSIT